MIQNRVQIKSFKFSAVSRLKANINLASEQGKTTDDVLGVHTITGRLRNNCSPVLKIKHMNPIKKVLYKKFINKKCIKKVAFK